MTVVASRRCAVVGVVAMSLVGALSGCSGGSSAAAGTTSATATTTSPPPTSASPTTTPTATPTVPPLSKFEGQAPVKVMRAWAAAIAKDINAGDKSATRANKLSVSAMVSINEFIVKDDAGVRYYPGPVPFTPTKVAVNGAKASISACWWAFGWGLKNTTKKPDEPRKIVATTTTLTKTKGVWRVDSSHTVTFSCAGVQVKGVAW